MITRPREDGEILARELAELGIGAVLEPLLVIENLDGPPVDLSNVQALLITSANGVRAFCRRNAERDLPVFCVGGASARAAREAGFGRVESGGGGVEELARLVQSHLNAQDGALMHIAGTRVAGDLAGDLERAGFQVRREVLYQAAKQESLSADGAAALSSGSVGGVVFYSPRTAKTFKRLVEEAGLAGACRGLRGFCLSQAVADQARPLFGDGTRVAARPDGAAMMALLAEWVRESGLGSDTA